MPSNCGCEKRGDRQFNCPYHEGFIDGREAGWNAALDVFTEEIAKLRVEGTGEGAGEPRIESMEFWFHLADKVAQKFGIPFLKIEELGLLMQNEARHLFPEASAAREPEPSMDKAQTDGGIPGHRPTDDGYCSCGVLCETGTQFRKHIESAWMEHDPAKCLDQHCSHPNCNPSSDPKTWLTTPNDSSGSDPNFTELKEDLRLRGLAKMAVAQMSDYIQSTFATLLAARPAVPLGQQKEKL